MTKADCRLVAGIFDCTSCCAETAVNAAAVEDDLAAVKEACGDRQRRCALDCGGFHAECVDQQCIACGELSCRNGIFVHATTPEPGTYRLEATIDGETHGCTIRRPSGANGPTSLTCRGAELFFDGSRVALFIANTTAVSVTFRATLDDTPIGETTFVPSYETEPGPNGPQCEPQTCLVAHATFP